MSLRATVNRLSFYINHTNVNYSNGIAFSINRFSYNSESSELLTFIRRKFHSSGACKDLMEFFDEKENWGEREVRVGRSWKVEELRIKSNSDLHKLWYVLLKERNMLMTMEHEYKAKFESFPNPERLDKVEESMENVEAVVRERNRAYYELETGENGERPVGKAVDCFGLDYQFKMCEHLIEKRLNKRFLQEERLRNHTTDYVYVKNFLTRLKEKATNQYLARRRYRYRQVCGILERFPNVDEEALQQHYPDVDIEEAKRDKKSRSHRENKF